jgi:hypothetical protein
MQALSLIIAPIILGGALFGLANSGVAHAQHPGCELVIDVAHHSVRFIQLENVPRNRNLSGYPAVCVPPA